MVITLQVQSRKKPKLGGIFEVADLASFIGTMVIAPVCFWYFFGWIFPYVMIPGVLWTIWFAFFRLGKPAGYTQHLLSYHLRNKLYTSNLNRTSNEILERINPTATPLPQEAAEKMKKIRDQAALD